MQPYQVIIIGGGPVGIALAIDLGQRGITCAVVESRREIARIPKGQNLAPRSLEHFYFWNCLNELRAARLLPDGYPVGGVRIYGDLTSQYWSRVEYHADSSGLYFQRDERLPQYLTEKVLRARVAQLANVTLLPGRTAVAITQDDTGVRATVRTPGGGEEVLQASYLVGCDGAHSFVRGQARISGHGTDLHQKMVLAVFSSPQLHEMLKHFAERSTYQIIDPALAGIWQFFGRVKVGVSWFYHGPVPQETTREDYGYIHRAMEKAAGFPFPAEFEHVNFWNLRAKVADTYRQGRVFIAGDAAHSHPPYGAHGLNAGLEDAANLGWKLAAVLAGWAGEALLDTYESERRPVLVQITEGMIMEPILRDREWLERHSPERDGPDFARAWNEYAAPRYSEHAQHYAGSRAVAGPPGAASGIDTAPSTEARPGHHLASQRLARGPNVFEELGAGFSLLAFGDVETAVEAMAAGARSLGIPLTIVGDTRGHAREAYGADLVLVRPDQYVAWAGDTLPPDAPGLFARLAGIG